MVYPPSLSQDYIALPKVLLGGTRGKHPDDKVVSQIEVGVIPEKGVHLQKLLLKAGALPKHLLLDLNQSGLSTGYHRSSPGHIINETDLSK